MKITAVRTLALGTEIDEPVSTSFGTMTQRTMILVNIQTDEGVEGWGESWSNFPAWSFRERIYTINDGLAPLIVGEELRSVSALHQKMRRATRILERQWGAPGPIAQAISAVDIALWDIAAKVQNKPLYELWEEGRTKIPVYASALGPEDPTKLVRAMQAKGVNAFKLKLGFGRTTDTYNLERIRDLIGADAQLMVDANQAWDVPTTLAMADVLELHSLTWLEEPIPADDWQGMAVLREALPFDLAAGENLFSSSSFKRLLELDALDIAQPDVCKIGGLSEMRDVCAAARDRGVPFAPHYLGGSVGFAASLHLLAGTPGGQVMEYDPHPHPLREAIAGHLLEIENGHVRVGSQPGLGVEVSENVVKSFLLEELVTYR